MSEVNIIDPDLPLEDFICQIIGAASVCWENPSGAGVFDSERASALCDELMQKISAVLR